VTLALTVVFGAAGGRLAADRGRPRPVSVHTESFVDSSRAPDRTLVTTIRIPESGGPYPVIVLAHGYNGHPRKFTQLLDAWAGAGYVVAAPAFPLTNDLAEGGAVVADFVNQPEDVSFVIDEIVRRSRVRGDELHGHVDRHRIGVAGLSLGGGTALAVTYNSCCRDRRVDAVISMAGFRLPFDGVYDFSGVPLLEIHGDTDGAAPYQAAADVYAEAAPPKFFVTIFGGGHAPPFEDAIDPADAMVTVVTTDFWNAYLKDRRAAVDRLLGEAVVDGLSALEYDAG
jgi:dienelactone hydrolase